MRNRKWKNGGERINIVWPVLVCGLALLFAVLSTSTILSMNQDLSALYEYPYLNAQHINRATNAVSLMRQGMNRLAIRRGAKDYAAVRTLVEEAMPELEESLDYIAGHYLGPAEDVDVLKDAAEQIVVLQQELLEHEEYEAQKAKRLLEEELAPLYDQFMEDSNVVMVWSTAAVREMDRECDHTTRKVVILAAVMTLFILTVSVLYYRSIQKKSRELEGRELLFSLLTETIDDVVYIYHATRRESEFLSGNTERVLGLTEEELLRDPDKRRAMFADQESFRMVEAIFRGTVLQKPVERECRIMNPKTKREQWMLLQVYPVLQDGGVERYIAKLEDQTEERRTRQTLRDALENARQANAAKRNFLSRMSHEIRTPMNAIIGMTAIAAADPDDRAKTEECLTKIAYSSKYLLSIINDVLDMSAIESGKISITREPFDLARLLTELGAVYESQCASRGVQFALTSDLSEEHLIGDQVRLNQILHNLLSNAVKFTPTGGRVRLEVGQTGQQGVYRQLCFTVSDTGIGMDEGFQKRMYLPFEQDPHAGVLRQGGTGLGLAIVRNLVTLMGGNIRVKSAPGKGSVFQVELPFEPDQSVCCTVESGERKDLRVLVADDDRGTCEHAALLLERMGMSVRWVLSGAEAVEEILWACADGTDYDVCILDWQMPGMDGIETARRIRERVGPDLLIIILSAYDWSGVEPQARAAGVNAFLSKPMFPSNLHRALREAAGHGKTPPAPARRCGRYDFTGRRILLAEDNQLNLEIAAALLESAGAAVDQVSEGRAAVRAFAQSPPGTYDMILLDVQMPVLDGHGAARAIRACPRPDAARIPIFAMTANAFAEDVAAAKAAGMNEHVAKPIDAEALYALLDAYFRGDKEE